LGPLVGDFVAGDYVLFKWINVKVTVMKEYRLYVLRFTNIKL